MRIEFGFEISGVLLEGVHTMEEMRAEAIRRHAPEFWTLHEHTSRIQKRFAKHITDAEFTE